MRRLLGIALGLGLLVPTLQYEVDLIERVTRALDGGEALSLEELSPPVDVAGTLDKVSNALQPR